MGINGQNLFIPLLVKLIHLFYFHRHLRLLMHRYCKGCVLFLVSSVLGFLILLTFGFPMSFWTTLRQLFAQFRLLQLLALDSYHAKLLPLLLPKVCVYRYIGAPEFPCQKLSRIFFPVKLIFPCQKIFFPVNIFFPVKFWLFSLSIFDEFFKNNDYQPIPM